MVVVYSSDDGVSAVLLKQLAFKDAGSKPTGIQL
jgi:hypothetical protein